MEEAKGEVSALVEDVISRLLRLPQDKSLVQHIRALEELRGQVEIGSVEKLMEGVFAIQKEYSANYHRLQEMEKRKKNTWKKIKRFLKL